MGRNLNAVQRAMKLAEPQGKAFAAAVRLVLKRMKRNPRPSGEGGRVSGWIGVDLDGTLAQYGGWKGPDHIGEPVPAMLFRVRNWLASGIEVRIFTARASVPEQIPPVAAWLEQHGIGGLAITNTKDFGMVELWDDRAVQVEPNTGRRMDGKP